MHFSNLTCIAGMVDPEVCRTKIDYFPVGRLGEETIHHPCFISLRFTGGEYDPESIPLMLKKKDCAGDFVLQGLRQCLLANADAEYFLKENIPQLPLATSVLSTRLLRCNERDT